MAQRTPRCLVVVALPLCAFARPAFADGVFASSGDYLALIFEFLLAVALAVLVGVLMLRSLVRIGRAAERKRLAKAAGPPIPVARVVESAGTERRVDRP